MSEYGGYGGDGGGGDGGGYGGYDNNNNNGGGGGGDYGASNNGGYGGGDGGGGFQSSSQGSQGSPSKVRHNYTIGFHQMFPGCRPGTDHFVSAFPLPTPKPNPTQQGKSSGTTTCTIAQLMKAEYNEEAAKYTMDGAQVAIVAIIGEVIDIEESPTYTKITLEDGTGQMMCKKWNDSENANDGDDSAPKTDLGVDKGMWIRVHCSVKEFNGSMTLNTHGLVKDPFQTDFNAITHHYLSAIVESLGKTKGKLSQLASGAGQAATKTAVYGQPAAFVAERTTGAAVVAEASGDDVQSQLRTIFSRPAPTDHGWSVDEIMGQLTSKVGRGSVKTSILGLCDDGELYSTIDDEHYASTA